MANVLYDNAKTLFATGGINLSTDSIKALLVTAAYVPAPSTDKFRSDIASGVAATSPAIASPVVTAGVFSGGNVTCPAVPSGAAITQIIVFKDTGTPTTSPLIAKYDTASSGLPITPNGSDITIQWDTGANKIFAV